MLSRGFWFREKVNKIAWAFCSDAPRRRRNCQYLAFNEAHMGLQGRAFQANILIADMVFLGDTRSVEELAVFTNMVPAVPATLPNVSACRGNFSEDSVKPQHHYRRTAARSNNSTLAQPPWRLLVILTPNDKTFSGNVCHG